MLDVGTHTDKVLLLLPRALHPLCVCFLRTAVMEMLFEGRLATTVLLLLLVFRWWLCSLRRFWDRIIPLSHSIPAADGEQRHTGHNSSAAVYLSETCTPDT